jgi:triosephosphate isomerase
MKKTLIVGNWKMHLNIQEASLLVHRLNSHVKTHRTIEVVLAPGFVALQPLSLEIDHRKFKLAAQNGYHKDEGAFTGEISFNQLRDLVHYSIIGHSDRRTYFGDTLEVVQLKVAAAVRNGITPIICVGETKPEKLAGETRRVVHDQVTTAVANLTAEEVRNIVIAYEPVWAIGTGTPEKPDEIAKTFKWIRQVVGDLYGADVAEAQRVIYGASVEPEFVHGMLSVEGLDGFLVCGASLIYKKFAGIIDKTYEFKHQ